MPYAMQISTPGTPDVLKKTEITINQPGPGEILIRNRAGAVNFIDSIIRRGDMPQGMMPALPHIPGVEGAGIIEALGDGVKGFTIGQGVAWMGPIGAGGYGTHSLIDSHYVVPLADDTDFSTAASVPVNALTAWHMLVNLGRARAGDTVLVHAAAGGVGTMALQIAKHLGVHTIASVSTGKTAYANSQGATHVVDYKSENLAERVLQITDGRGVDITLNPVAGDSLREDLNILAPLGTAILFGFLAGQPQGDFAHDLTQHFQKSIAIRVSDIYTYFSQQPDAFNQDMRNVFNLMEKKVLTPQFKTLPLVHAAQAHRALESGNSTGKWVLTID